MEINLFDIVNASDPDDPKKTSGKPNFTLTKDPDTVMGKHGTPITRAQFERANKNGYAWKDFEAYADYVGGWAKPIKDPAVFHPYYRTYPGGKINGVDIEILAAKNDPKINEILKRNIAPAGQVPQFGAQDSDAINSLIKKEREVSGVVPMVKPYGTDQEAVLSIAQIKK